MVEVPYERKARAKWYKGQDPVEKFWSRFERQPGEDGCLYWTAALRENGYGMMKWNGKLRSTHTIAFELVNGPIPEGMVVRHTCDIRHPAGDATYRRCGEPTHLKLGTRKENSEDMVAANRQARGQRHGAHTRPMSKLRGEDHAMAWLTNDQVESLRKQFPPGSRVPYTALAEEYGCNRQTIHNALHNRFWNNVEGAQPVTGPRHKVGSEHGQSKFTEALVIEVRTRHLEGTPISVLCREKNIGRATMRDAIEGVTWKHVPGAVSREDRPKTEWRKGSEQRHAILTDDIVREARRLYDNKKGMKIKAINRLFPDIGYAILYDAVTGKTWQHVQD